MPLRQPLPPPIFEMDRVDVVRGDTRLVSGLTLRVDVGQHTVVLGPNGSGKSTLLKLLMRWIYPSIVEGRSGRIEMFGKSEWNVWELRSQLGFVSSELDHHFLSGRSGRLTAMQTVLTGMFSSELEPDPDAVTPAMRQAASEALQRMEIEALAERPVGHLSTGERRRVMLARALVHRPEAMVLDEPTSGLDIRAQRKLLQRLEHLAQSGTTLILVTHHFDEVLPCARRTILLRGGEIVFDGPTEEAMTSQRLSHVYDWPLQSHRRPDGSWTAS